jgi:hypothetical protein
VSVVSIVSRILLPILLIGFASGVRSDQILLEREPMRQWVIWIKSLAVPPQIPSRDIHRPRERLTQDQWNVERAYLVVSRIEGHCSDLTFGPGPFHEAIYDRGVDFTGFSLSNPGHQQREEAQQIHEQMRSEFERYGQDLCKALYGVLGPGGDLVSAFRRFTSQSKFQYETQVLWRSKDICDRPEEFWLDNNIEGAAIEYQCRRADEKRALWKDY